MLPGALTTAEIRPRIADTRVRRRVLQVDDLVEVPDGLRVLIRRSKTDQTGRGRRPRREVPVTLGHANGDRSRGRSS